VLKAGDRLGDWVIEGTLGEGGMGAVYRAHSTHSERLRAALKVLKPTEEPAAAERFVREAEALTALSHPAVVRVMGFGRDPGRGLLFLVMELAEGETLTARLKRGPLSLEEALSVFGLLAAALEHAHAAGIYHRDLKPANVVLCVDGTVRLVDFGIAAGDGWAGLTGGGHLGTPAYLPPEVFRGQRAHPQAIDVYGFGMLLYEALTGTKAFPADAALSPPAAAAAIGVRKLEQREPLDPGPGTPDDVREAVRLATHPQAAERPAMRLVARTLQRAGRGQGRRAADEEPTMRVAEPAGVPVHVEATARTAGAWWAGLGDRGRAAVIGGAVLLLALAVLLVGRRRPAASPPAAAPRREVWRNPADGLDYAAIPAGTFQMGCPAGSACPDTEKPRRDVTLPRPFRMGRTEVTTGAYARFAAERERRMPPAPPHDRGWDKNDLPMANVTWAEARDFCRWAGGRLPSEAEWEYAARAGRSDVVFPWGSDDPSCRPGGAAAARFRGEGCAGDGPAPVASYASNRFGLFDMAGNVWELTADEWSPSLEAVPADGRAHGGAGRARAVVRGGSWAHDASVLRVSVRDWVDAQGRGPGTGFRCVVDLPQDR
jgi:formylglycine-generating enzyme required for sulfatase activity